MLYDMYIYKYIYIYMYTHIHIYKTESVCCNLETSTVVL